MEIQFLLTPLREGRHVLLSRLARLPNFYSRPCGRGDIKTVVNIYCETSISTHAPAGGATQDSYVRCMGKKHFYSRPCGRGDVMVAQPVKPSTSISTHAPAGGATPPQQPAASGRTYFYSRPCGRGDGNPLRQPFSWSAFLLTPLREGRPDAVLPCGEFELISTHAPAGGATRRDFQGRTARRAFLLTPLREGRLPWHACDGSTFDQFLLTPLREGRPAPA